MGKPTESKDRIEFRVRKKKPKPNAKSYDLVTIQDIFDATNCDNVDGFLKEFKIILHSLYLVRAVIENSIAEGKAPKDTKMPPVGILKWTDD